MSSCAETAGNKLPPYLWKAIGMRRNDGHISRLWIGITERDVLLHRDSELGLLIVERRSRVFSNVLTRHHMLVNLEVRGRHGR